MMYLGSKKRFAGIIWEMIKKNAVIDSNTAFIDLMAGGCGMISQVPLKNRIANDISTPLVEYMKKIQEDVSWMPRTNFLTKEKYNFIKKHKDLYEPWFLGYVGYNFSFGASYFQGFRAEGSVLSAYKSASKDKEMLKGVKFYNLDYQDVPIPPHSIVYCDIPYKGTVGYNAVEGEFDYERFYSYARKLKEEGHYVFISEYGEGVPEDFKLVGEFKRRGTLDGKKSRKGKSGAKYEKFK